MIDSIKHILGTCGESHINIFTLIFLTIALRLVYKKQTK